MSTTTTGIRARHARGCATAAGRKTCNCHPSYEAFVFDVRAHRKIRKSFPSLAAAKAWRADALGDVRRGTLSAGASLTLRQAADDWLAGAKAGVIPSRSGSPYKPGPLRLYESLLRRFVLPDLGGMQLAALRRADLQALADRMLRAGASPSTIHNALMPVRALCRYALERDLVASNPTSNLRLPAASGRRERAASPSEVAALIEALPPDDQPLWWCAALAGLRRGELRALRWQDVDLAENLIRVRRSWDDYEGEQAPKSEKGKRRVPIPPSLRRVLLAWKLRSGRDGSDLVFGRSPSAPFAPFAIRARAQKAWAAAAVGAFLRGEGAALEPIGLHELRHSYVSQLAEAGFSLPEIGDYVGHSSAWMTDRYRHLLAGREAEAAERFEAYLALATEA